MKDSILFWNAVALEANRVSFSDPAKAEQQGPTLSSRALAIIHLAMYDAYAAVIRNAGFPRYLPIPSLPPPMPPTPMPANNVNNIAAAVAGAAYKTLSSLYATQIPFFKDQVVAIEPNFDDPAQQTPSFKFGIEVADAILKYRESDPGNSSVGYQISTKRGRYRVDPDNPTQTPLAPFYGYRSKCFASSKRYTITPPPFDNNKYLTSLKEVRAKGIKPELTGTLPSSLFDDRRTSDETTIGIFWAYDGANRLGTPPRLYNQIVREIAIKKNNSEGDNARLFAFVNAAMGDAGILAWEQKYCHDFWRPVTGIREHSTSTGPAARNPQDAENSINEDGDPFWLPLGAPNTNRTVSKNFTPNFPAYPSGHATFGAAAFHVTRLFYGKGFESGGTAVITGGKLIIKNGNLVKDDLTDGLGFVSEELNGMNQDNLGTVRPRHVRSFNFDSDNKHLSGGLGRMIIENAISRVYLGVHWMFDAFAGKNGKPEFNTAGLEIGGVPLGLKIAEDIFKTGGGKAPKLSTTTDPAPNLPGQPGNVAGCADNRPSAAAAKKGKKDEEGTGEETQDKLTIEPPYLGGVSRR